MVMLRVRAYGALVVRPHLGCVATRAAAVHVICLNCPRNLWKLEMTKAAAWAPLHFDRPKICWPNIRTQMKQIRNVGCGWLGCRLYADEVSACFLCCFLPADFCLFRGFLSVSRICLYFLCIFLSLPLLFLREMHSFLPSPS